MTMMQRSLAKGLMPALLLSAALSVPAASWAAPSPHGKAHAADKAKKNQHPKKPEKARKAAQQHARKQAAQRQVKPVKVKKGRTIVVQRAAPRRVTGRPSVVVVPKRVAPRSQVVVTRPRSVAPVRRYAWDGWNRRSGRYATTGTFQLDGTFVDRQYGCALVQDRYRQVIPLVGFDPLVPRRGEQFLLTGRVENGTSCGTAFRVFSVDRVWSDASHRTLIFDRRHDGDYFGNYRGRYDDSRYDRGDGRLISLYGRLDDGGRCPAIRGDNGEYYDLVGDLRGFRDGDHARVVGLLGSRSRCGGPAIDVRQIDS